MALKFAWELEAWTLPGVGTFQAQITAIPAISVGWSDPKNEVGGGTFTIDPRYADLDSICDPDNDVETLIRVKVGSTYIYNFYARNRTDEFDDTGVTQIGGPGLADLLNHAIVYPYDYPEEPSLQPDWIFGSEENGIRNPGFEEVPKFISNNTFEDGTTQPWVPGPLTTFENSGDQFKTGTRSLKATPAVIDAGVSLTIPVVPNSFHGVDVWVFCAGGGTMELAVSVPGDIRKPLYSATTPDTIVGTEIVGTTAQPVDDGTGEPELNIQYGSGITNPDDPNFQGVVYTEFRKQITGTASWQHMILHFWTGNNQTSVQVSVRARGHTNTFYIDDFGQFGNGVGLTGWDLARVGAQTFQASLPITADVDNVNQETGNWCASITANRTGMGIRQTVTGIRPGHKYTVTARIRASAGTDIRLVVTDPMHNWIPGAFDIGAPSVGGAYNTYSATFTMPKTWPGDNQQVAANEAVIVKIMLGEDNAVGGSETFYVDSVSLVPGEPATTIGDILDQLIQDAAADHIGDGRTTSGGGGHLSWLQYDFDAVRDSALPTGSLWATTANPTGLESITVKRGMSYLQLLEQVVARLGYDWRVIVTPTNNFKLQVYNPEGGGVNRSGTVSLVTGKVGPSSLGLNGLHANVIFGEGKNRIYHEEVNASDITAYGRRELYTPRPDLIGDDTLASWVQARALVESGFKEGHRIELMDTSDFHPYIDFKVSDTITVDLGSYLSSRALQVKSVTVTLDDSKAKFDIDVNTDPPPSQAIPNIALAKILKRFQGIDDNFQFGGGADVRVDNSGISVPEGGGGAGMVSVVVAAYNASPESRARADFVCDGTNDDVEIKAAILLMQYDSGTGSGGHVQLTEGDFWVRPNQIDIGVGDIGYYQVGGASLSGVGATTRIHCDMATTHTGVQTTSRHGTISWLLKAGFSGFIRDLSIVGGGGPNGSSPLAGIFISGNLNRLSGITWQWDANEERGDETTYQRMHSVILTKSNFCTIEDLQAFGGSWDETEPLNIVTGDGNGMLQVRGANFYNLGDGSVVESRHGVYLFNIDSNRPNQITTVRIYNVSGSVLHINGGSDVTMRNVYIENFGSPGGPAVVSKGANGNSTLELTDWYLNNLQTGLPFLSWDTSQLLLTMRNVLAPGYKTTIDTSTNSCRVDIANSRLGDISVTVGGTLRGMIANSTLGANTNGAGAAISVLGAGTSGRFRIFNTIYDSQLAKQFANWTNISASHAAGVVYLQNDATGGSTGAVHGGTAPAIVANVGDNLP